MALHTEPKGQVTLISKATSLFDRIDFALNWMDGAEIKEINKELAAICKRHNIGKIVTDGEGNPRLSNMPSTEEVKSKSDKTKKDKSKKDKSKSSNRNGDDMPAKTAEMSKAEVRQYMEDHMIDMRGTFEKKAAYVAEHMVSHGKLVKKGLDRLLALIEKHDVPFKDDRRKREEVRASMAADAILADGFVVEGKGITKPGADEEEAPKSKKTSSKKPAPKEDTKSSKKSTAKSTSSKRSRKDEDEDEDDEEEERPRKSKKTKKVVIEDTPKKKVVVKETKKTKKSRDEDDEDEAPRKSKKTSSSSKSSSKDKTSSTKKKSRR